MIVHTSQYYWISTSKKGTDITVVSSTCKCYEIYTDKYNTGVYIMCMYYVLLDQINLDVKYINGSILQPTISTLPRCTVIGPEVLG